jgi:hypothetical protein
MTSSTPLVSIGMPVRNGEPYLQDAINSLLDQDFKDFELLISDNASEDGTPDICHSFAQRDDRIVYQRLPENIGASRNFDRVLSLASAPYFMWAAHDDRWDPRFISMCLDRLEGDPDAVSCATAIQFIDEFDRTTGRPQDGTGLSSESWASRVGAIVARQDRFIGFGFYGLHRTAVLRQMGPLAEGFGADVLLTLRLAKAGRWCWIPQPLFRYRILAKQEGELTWRLAANVEERPVSHLIAVVWEEIGTGPPTRRDRLVARCRFALAVARPGRGWKSFLLKENGNLLRSALHRRDVPGVLRHASRRIVLDPLAPLRRKNWQAVAGVRRASAEEPRRSP